MAQSIYSAKLDASSVVWIGKKVTGEHTGEIALKMGELEMDGELIKSGKFEIDMKSITNTDLKQSNQSKKLVNHLKSDDFFAVEEYPTARFVVKGAKKLHGNTYQIKGDMTIKGITHPLVFTVVLHKQEGEMHVEAKMVVDRAKYNVRYGSDSFFSNLGNRMIYDDFDLNVKLILESR